MMRGLEPRYLTAESSKTGAATRKIPKQIEFLEKIIEFYETFSTSIPPSSEGGWIGRLPIPISEMATFTCLVNKYCLMKTDASSEMALIRFVFPCSKTINKRPNFAFPQRSSLLFWCIFSSRTWIPVYLLLATSFTLTNNFFNFFDFNEPLLKAKKVRSTNQDNSV